MNQERLSSTVEHFKEVRSKKNFVHIPVRWLVMVGAVVGIISGLVLYLAGNYLGVVLRQARDAYVVYRLSGERDELLATKDRLERELEVLRTQHGHVSEFQNAVKTRLDELNAVVESSTALGLFQRERKGFKTGRQIVVASNRGNGASLSDTKNKGIRLKTEYTPLEKLKAINRGLGGAEVECSKDRNGKIACTSIQKEDVSYEEGVGIDVQPAAAITSNGLWNSEQKALLERVSKYTELLRSLPIGAPVAGELTSGFGYRISPFSRRSSFHEGVDISLDSGSKVLVTGDGIVVKVGYEGTYGFMIDVVHAKGVVSRYAHLSRTLVRRGQRVQRGQLIAFSGSTGRSTGPHLHYEVRMQGMPKDPVRFINLADKLSSIL